MNRNRFTRSIRILLTLAAAGLFPTAQADVLLQYNFEDPAGSTTTTASPTTIASGITGPVSGSDFDVNEHPDGDDGNLRFSTFNSDTPEVSVFEFTTNTSLAVTDATYWHFTITAEDPLNLSDLRFAIGAVSEGGNPETTLFNVTSSVNNHQSFLAPENFEYTGRGGDTMSAPENQVVDLSGAAFQNLDATAGIDFRIYFANEAGSGASGVRLDTVSLNGAVIPEPSSLILIGVALLAAVGMRARKR